MQCKCDEFCVKFAIKCKTCESGFRVRSAVTTELRECVRAACDAAARRKLRPAHLDITRCLCSAGVCWSMKSSMKGNEKKSSEARGAESPSPDAAQNTILCLAASPVMMSLVLSASPTLIVRWACVCCFNLQIQGVSCLMSWGGAEAKCGACFFKLSTRARQCTSSSGDEGTVLEPNCQMP